jgi:hypothetical protein
VRLGPWQHARAGCQFLRELPETLINDLATKCGRPAHDHWTISANSGQHISQYQPVMIAPFLEIDRDGAPKKNYVRNYLPVALAELQILKWGCVMLGEAMPMSKALRETKSRIFASLGLDSAHAVKWANRMVRGSDPDSHRVKGNFCIPQS